jgi:hypothetical protein
MGKHAVYDVTGQTDRLAEERFQDLKPFWF